MCYVTLEVLSWRYGLLDLIRGSLISVCVCVSVCTIKTECVSLSNLYALCVSVLSRSLLLCVIALVHVCIAMLDVSLCMYLSL